MERLQNKFMWAVLLSETTHIFCCVLPSAVSIMSLMANVGLMSAVPGGLDRLHDMIHNYEIPLIIFSGIMLALGWALHVIARRLDCRSTGCAHEPCGPTKKRSLRIMQIATILFAANLTIYSVFHLNDPLHTHHGHDHAHEQHNSHSAVHEHDGHDHHGHDHHDH